MVDSVAPVAFREPVKPIEPYYIQHIEYLYSIQTCKPCQVTHSIQHSAKNLVSWHIHKYWLDT